MAQAFEQNSRYSDDELTRRRDFDRSRPVDRDESTNLISSDKVDGTAVYATDGEKIGHISYLMIGKRSGRVEYAVMSFGGFLGIGESYHPLPWDVLDYDTGKGGYVVNIDKDRLKDSPRYGDSDQPSWDRQYGENVYSYYGFMY